MGKKNGYFELVIHEHGTFLRLIPPTEGGEKINVAEVAAYLTKQKINGFDVRKLIQ